MRNTRNGDIAKGRQQDGKESSSTANNDISDSEGQGFHQEQSDKGRTRRSFKGPG